MFSPVDVSKIEIPKKWRTLRKAVVEQLAESLEHDGLLHPIGVRPHPKKEGCYELVYGRHRLEAARKLAWATIEAKNLAFDDDAAASATNAENLFRHELNAAERVIAFKTQQERYHRLHPRTARRGVRGDADDQAPAFRDYAESTTGVPAGTVERYIRAGKNLSPEQLGVLAETPKVTLVEVREINKLDEPKRQEAVSLIALGVNPKEAISRSTLPPDAVMTEPAETLNADGQAEDDLSDEAWVETYCGEVMARLKYTAPFKRDAVLYRHSREARHKLRGASKKLLSQSMVQVVGPFYRLYARFVNMDHPKNWLPCGPCGGSGMSGDKSKCGNCRGDAYVLKTAGGGR